MNFKRIAALTLLAPSLALQLGTSARAYAPQQDLSSLSPTFPEHNAEPISQKQVTEVAWESRALECYVAGGTLGQCLYWDIFLRD